ncbi:hypothetical protein Tco_1161228 [Tanacetum coccineum]
MSSKKGFLRTRRFNKDEVVFSKVETYYLIYRGRLTLLKSVLGSTPIYNMLIFKVPKSVLNYMESLRRNFFNGFQEGDRKIAWVKWSKVLAYLRNSGGWEFSSIFALNRALLFSGLWRYLSPENPYGPVLYSFTWLEWVMFFCCFQFDLSELHLTEVNSLKVEGFDSFSLRIRVGKGTGTSFWKDLWIGDNLLKLSFPRLFALEENKDISVADKMNTSIPLFVSCPQECRKLVTTT